MMEEPIGPTVVKCNEEWQKGFLLAFFDDCSNPYRVDDDWPYAKFRSFRQFTFYEHPEGVDKAPDNLFDFEEFFGKGGNEAARLTREYRQDHRGQEGPEERVDGLIGHPNYTEALVIKEGEALRTVAYICQDGLVVKGGFEPEVIDKNIVVFKKKD